MTVQFADRAHRIKPSATLAVSAKAQALRAQGIDVISLGSGEPDFDTPDHIKQAAITAINEGFTKYTAVDGIPELKNAIVNKLEIDNGLSFKPEQILVSCGAKQCIFNLAQALLNDGDEVIIPAPYWVSYPDIVALAGGKPVIIATDIKQHFKISPEQLAAAITNKTKLVMLNSPSNPTGVAYTAADLQALGEVLRAHPDVLIASDDIYEHILWAEESFHNIATTCPDLLARTVVINGVSKAYSMTGWRIGYAAGPQALIKVMKKIQSQSTSNPNSIAQKAATAALEGGLTCIQAMCQAFKVRHDFVVNALNAMPGVHCLASDGAFYAFPNVVGLIEKLPGVNDDVQLATYLLEKAQVAVVPGTAFGQAGYIRLSFATSQDNLDKAMQRIGAVASS